MLKFVLVSFIVVLTSILSSSAWSYDFKGFVSTQNGSELYVRYQKAEPGKDTFVFVNGLVYEIERWEKVSSQLKKQGFGVLHYEFEGQYRSFKKSMDQNDGQPEWLYRGLNLDYMAEQLDNVVDRFKLDAFNVVALSYGASIASEYTLKYEDKVKKLILMSPLVIPLENYHSQGRQFHLWLDSLELWGPVGSFWANYYYDLVYKWYYKKQPSSRVYDFGPWEKDYYRSVFHQVKAVRKFDLRKNLKKLNSTKVFFLTAEKEDQTYLPDQQNSWVKLKNKVKGSLIHVQKAYHAIPDTAPGFTALYLKDLAGGNRVLGSSSAFNGTIKNGKLVLKLRE